LPQQHRYRSNSYFFLAERGLSIPPVKLQQTRLEKSKLTIHRYYIKGDCQGSPTRASEWIGTLVADYIGITAPPPVVIQRLNGDLVFGSRRLAGVADDVITQNYLMNSANLEPNSSSLTGILSSIYAFDLFINNVDRHFGNYLTVQDIGARRLFAFDYGRSLFFRWPWTDFPAPGDHTRICGKVLRSTHGFDVQAAHAVLDKLARVAPTVIDAFLNQMPGEWLPQPLRREFIRVWSEEGRHARINALRKGLDDGSLL